MNPASSSTRMATTPTPLVPPLTGLLPTTANPRSHSSPPSSSLFPLSPSMVSSHLQVHCGSSPSPLQHYPSGAGWSRPVCPARSPFCHAGFILASPSPDHGSWSTCNTVRTVFHRYRVSCLGLSTLRLTGVRAGVIPAEVRTLIFVLSL
jgi:hypothetical protein